MIDHLLPALSSDNPAVIERAIIDLGASQDPKAVAPLVRSLLKFNGQPELIALICDALGDLGDLRATQALLSQLRSKDDFVRESAFTALLEIGQRRASSMPEASGLMDANEALTQIAWQTDLEAVQLLVRALDEGDSEVKIGALYTLGQLGFIGALTQISRELLNPNDEIAAAAAFSLGELAQVTSEQIREGICQTLYQVWQSESIGSETRTQVLRAAAECKALSESTQNILANIFVSALDRPEHTSRQLAVIGLGRLKDPRAATLLATRLQDEEVGVRRNAAYALGDLNTPESIEILVHNSIEQSSEVRVAIINSLLRAPRELAINSVYKALYSADHRYRSSAAQLLGGLKDQNGLLKTLQDEDSRVRKNSALAIGAARLSDLTSALIPMLNDPDWRVRAAVAEGLKRLKMQNVRPHIEAQLKHESHPVVLSALERALHSLTSLS